MTSWTRPYYRTPYHYRWGGSLGFPNRTIPIPRKLPPHFSLWLSEAAVTWRSAWTDPGTRRHVYIVSMFWEIPIGLTRLRPMVARLRDPPLTLLVPFDLVCISGSHHIPAQIDKHHAIYPASNTPKPRVRKFSRPPKCLVVTSRWASSRTRPWYSVGTTNFQVSSSPVICPKFGSALRLYIITSSTFHELYFRGLSWISSIRVKYHGSVTSSNEAISTSFYSRSFSLHSKSGTR